MPEFNDEAKGQAFLDEFVDPGPPYDTAAGPPAEWFRSVVEQSNQVYIALGQDTTIWYVNDAVEVLLGYTPAEMIGRSGLDFVAPEDLAEAADTVYHAAEVEGWRPPRPFRMVAKSGELVSIEFEGLALFHEPAVGSAVVIGRHGEANALVDRILDTLASHGPLPDVLDQLVFLMHKPGWRLGVVIEYDAGDGTLAVAHSGLPEALRALSDHPESPWARARATGELVVDVGLESIDPEMRKVADALRYRTCWAVPVTDPAGGLDASIVVWNGEAVPPELGQDRAFRRLRHVLGLALDARAQLQELARAARTDALTGLANRRRYDEHISDLSGLHAITVLFADLDGFKAINDTHGHGAGDQVIAAVGRRLQGVVRTGDVAARIGGDEFALVCNDLPEATAITVAERLIEAVGEPIRTDARDVTVGVSIGIALGEAGKPITIDRLVGAADEALYAAKAAGKNRYDLVRLAP